MGTQNQGMFRARFVSTRNSDHLDAEIGPGTTGQEALNGLVEAKFIEPARKDGQYALALERTGKTIPLNATLVSHGVKDGDVVTVTETSMAAGR